MSQIRQPQTAIRSPILLALLCTAPALTFSYLGVQSPWNAFRLSRAAVALQLGHIPAYSGAASAYRAEHLGGEILTASWITATGWPLDWIGYLPVGALLLAIIYYGVAYQVSGSPAKAAAVTIFASWYYPRLNSQYGLHLYAWTNALFLSFLLVFWRWLKAPRPVEGLLILLLFSALFLHYHTTPGWIIICLITAAVTTRLRRSPDAAAHASLALLTAIIYLTFDTVIFGNVLGQMRSGTTAGSLVQSALSKIAAPLLRTSPAAADPLTAAPLSPPLATWSTLAALLILTVPTGLWCLQQMRRAIRSGNLGSMFDSREHTFIWALIAAALFHTLAYTGYGALSLRVVPLAFPLILPLVCRQLDRSGRLARLLLPGLAACAMVGFGGYTNSREAALTPASMGAAGQILHPDRQVLTGADVYGALQVSAAVRGSAEMAGYIWPDGQSYSAALGLTPRPEVPFDTIVVDKTSRPVTSSNWVFYQPWQANWWRLESSQALDKIYDSDQLSIFQRRGRSLSEVSWSERDSGHQQHALIADSLRAAAALLLLAFLPGAALMILLKPTGELSRPPEAMALSVGLSICIVTMAGYGANFTEPGLKKLLPLLVLITAGLALGALLRRPHQTVRPAWRPLMSAAALLLIWSLTGAAVARARQRLTPPGIEFFLSALSQDSDMTLIRVIHPDSTPANYEVMLYDAAGWRQIGRRRLTAAAAEWLLPWRRPRNDVVLLLLRDQRPLRELHLFSSGTLEPFSSS